MGDVSKLYIANYYIIHTQVYYGSSTITYRVSKCMTSSEDLPTQPASVGVGTVWTLSLSSTTFILWCDAVTVLEYDYGSLDCYEDLATPPDEMYFSITTDSDYRLQPGK